MKNILSKIVTIFTSLVILAILFFSLKGCVVKVWKSPDKPTTYAIHSSDGRSLTMIFLPKHETILVYTKEKAKFMEVTLTQMRGTYGTHYFWRLWRLEGPGVGGGWLGIRIYPDGTEPVVMEITVLQKFIHGSSKPALRNKGDRTHSVILFSENAVRFQDMWLEKEPTNLELVQALMRKLKPQ